MSNPDHPPFPVTIPDHPPDKPLHPAVMPDEIPSSSSSSSPESLLATADLFEQGFKRIDTFSEYSCIAFCINEICV